MVTVIIPIYNKEKYLNACLDSIINQSYKDLEIILINDGSKDNSLSICKKYQKRDSRIIIIDKENEGVSAARNEGIQKATGKKIVFVDADDCLEGDYIERLMQYETDLVVCGFKLINESGAIINESKLHSLEEHEYDKSLKICLLPAHSSLMVVPYSKLFDKKIIDENNLLFCKNLSFGEDAYFVFDYIKHITSVSFIEYSGYLNKIIDGTLSRRYIKNLEKQMEILNESIKTFDNLKYSNEISYYLFRNYKLVLYNERYSDKKTFFLKEKYINQQIKNYRLVKKHFSFYDRVIYYLLRLKLYYLVYLIYLLRR